MPSHQRRSSINLARSHFLTQYKVVSLAASEKCQPFLLLLFCSLIVLNPLEWWVECCNWCTANSYALLEPNRKKNTCDWQERYYNRRIEAGKLSLMLSGLCHSDWHIGKWLWNIYAFDCLSDGRATYVNGMRLPLPRHSSIVDGKKIREMHARYAFPLEFSLNSELSWNLLTKYVWLLSKWSFLFNLSTVLTHQTAHAIFSSLNSTCNSIAKIQFEFDNDISSSFWQ